MSWADGDMEQKPSGRETEGDYFSWSDQGRLLRKGEWSLAWSKGASHVDVGCKWVLAGGTASAEVLKQKWRWWIADISEKQEWLRQSESYKTMLERKVGARWVEGLQFMMRTSAAEREGRLLQYPGEKMVTAHATVLWRQMEVKSAQVGRVLCVVLCEVSQTGFLCMCVSQTGFLPLPLLMMQSVWVCVCVCVKGRNGCDWT